ncbi:hypothetical protein ACFQU3_16640 [Terrabacter sp. GCM10028922]|uniref:hypothetical protein n=1 Tax=Terrabacter sp. GCM10028922 TaxID=3273428 RepID=UPI003615EA94
MPLTHPSTPADAPGSSPVFLDLTGRRLRRVRLLGASIALVVIGYVGLLLSAALGGPTIDAPFLPRPAAPTHGLAKLPPTAVNRAVVPSSGDHAPAGTGGAVPVRATSAEPPRTPSAPVPSSTGTPVPAATVTARPTAAKPTTAKPLTVPASTRRASTPTAPGLTQRPTPTTSR